MIHPYFARLVCLSLAAFFGVHLLAGLLVRMATPWTVRAAERLRPRLAARILLALRFLPIALGLFVVAALCVPSYLWLEPEGVGEEVGFAGVAASAAAIALWIGGMIRGVRATIRSRRRIEAGAPLLAIAGIVRPRLLVAPGVLKNLSHDQCDVALCHEEAHFAAFDNGKRLLLALAPGLLPGVHGFGALEREWQRFTERAADDDAVRGDPARALSLAAALVQVARMGPVAVPLAASLLDGDDLPARVDRLLHPRVAEPWDAQPVVITAAAVLTVAASFTALALRPASLESMHRLLEQMIR